MGHADPADRAAWEHERAQIEARERRASMIERGLIRLAQARPDWYRHAACKGNTEIMFDVVDTDRALAICAICPVVEPCRQQARRDREQGTWGGETEVDRYNAGRGSSTNVAARNKARQEIDAERKREAKAARRAAAVELAARTPAWKIIEARERTRSTG